MKTGLEIFLEAPPADLASKRVALVANPTTVDHNFVHGIDLMHQHSGINITKLFGAEHGIRASAQDQIGVTNSHDPITGLPEISLYGKTFESLSPSLESLEDVDVLIFDIQDIGSRYYTYQATMALCMQQAAKAQVQVIILDRPNPISAQVEGGGILDHLKNFCGIYPIPQRHGMTVGELAKLYKSAGNINCDLTVIPCTGWKRHQYFDELDGPWVLPSPNMPTLDTAIVYPGTCLFEGTNISEARGTTRPFELFGAPFVDPYALKNELEKLDLPGILYRPACFEPTFHKFANQICNGLQLHVTCRENFLPYKTGVALLWALRKLWPEQFQWKTDVYEFRDDVPAIDLLTGFPEVREAIDNGKPFEDVITLCGQGRQWFNEHQQAAFLYE